MNDLPDPPYPADTRAKGWRFELDMERARQSDTWALAPSEVRPWLLMLWATAWEQVPAGSMTADDQLICAHIGMQPKLFAKHREVLMRRWWKASDGRLYHDVLVQRVTEMLDTRRAEADRKAAWRAKRESERSGGPTGQASSDAGLTQESGSVPVVSRGTDTGQTRESHGIDDTRTRTRTRTRTIEELLPPAVASIESASPASAGARKRASTVSPQDLAEHGVDPQHAADWIAVRKAKGCPLTMTAWRQTMAESVKAGISVAEAVQIAAANGWAGFRAHWLQQSSHHRGNGSSGAAEPPWLKEQRDRVAEFAGRAAMKNRPGTKSTTQGVIDVDAKRLD